jgi:uncharacterized membrane protein (Fun14 family)
VVDPEEPEATQKLRVQLHGIRVALIRAARRLGYDHDNGIVKQARWAAAFALGFALGFGVR